MKLFDLREDAPYLHNAYHLALAAHAVYWDDPAEGYPEIEWAFSKVIRFHNARVFGYVAGNDSHVVLTFRGTDDNRMWLEGLSYGQVASGPGRVHQGLAEALEAVWQRVLAACYDVGAHEKTIWLAGHSLGGSLAVLAAQRLSEEGFEPHLVCTYGAPRVLNPVSARAFKTPLYRFVNNEDVVPDLPWPTLLDTYEHAGEKVLLLPSGKIAEKRHSPGLARRIDRAETIGEGILPSGMVHDHQMDHYIAKLELHV